MDGAGVILNLCQMEDYDILYIYIYIMFLDISIQGRRSHLKGGAEKLVKDSAQHGWAQKKILYFASFQVIPRSHSIREIKHLSKIRICHQIQL